MGRRKVPAASSHYHRHLAEGGTATSREFVALRSALDAVRGGIPRAPAHAL